MNINRRAFLAGAVLLPVAGLAVVSRLGQEKPLVATRDDFAREARFAWDNARDFNTETMRYKSRNTWHAPEGDYTWYRRGINELGQPTFEFIPNSEIYKS